MTTFSRYVSYKETDTKWLGSIPEHWDLTRVKYVSNLTPKKPIIDGSLECSFIPMEKLKTDTIVLDEFRAVKDVYDGYTYFTDQDILMAKVTPCFENKNIAVAVNLKNGIGFGSSEIYVIRTNSKSDSRYLFYRLQEDGFMEVATAAMTGAGGLRRVPSDTVNNFLLALPSISEQRCIASFLDHETAKIDTLIEKQQQLIKLLNEKRQALISHAVTKGLNPYAPMKDSGVEWLGEVPEHWTAPKARYAAKLESGHTPSRSNPMYWKDCYIPWISLSDVWQLREGRNKYIESTKETISEIGLENSAARLLPKGTVILSRTASVGFAGIMRTAMATTQDFANWVCDERLNPEFLLYCFWAMKSEFDKFMVGSTHKTIYMPDIKELRIAFPPVEEQQLIVSHLNRIVPMFDDLQDKTKKAIELLNERRTALISASVTGKIDVRNFKAGDTDAA